MREALLLSMFLICNLAYAETASSKVELVEKLMETYELTSTLTLYTSTYTIEAKRLHKNFPDSFWESREYKKALKDYETTLWNGWRQAYIEYLTEEELSQIIAFTETPLGKKFLMMQRNMEPIFTTIATDANSELNDKFFQLMHEFESRQKEGRDQKRDESI